MTRKNPGGLNPENPYVENEDNVTEMVQGPDGTFVEKSEVKREKAERKLKEKTHVPQKELGENLDENTGLTNLDLTPAQIEKKEEFKESLDLYDVNSITSYGYETTGAMESISSKILATKKASALEAVGEEVKGLITALETGKYKKESRSLIGRIKNWAIAKKNGYLSVESIIEKIEGITEKYSGVADGYIPVIDELMKANEDRYYELCLLITAANERLKEMKKEIEDVAQEYMTDGELDGFEAAKLQELNSNIKQFIQKIDDLVKLRDLAVVNAVTLVGYRNTAVGAKQLMQNAACVTIPVIRMQGVQAVVGRDLKEIVDTSKLISDTTQEIIKKNADLTHDLIVGATEEIERPVIESETMEYAIKGLTDTYKDVEKIIKDSEKKRLAGNAKIEKMLTGLTGSTTKQLGAPKK